MASTSSAFQPDSDVYITFEDQQKINRFARLNAKMEDIKEEIKLNENQYKNIEDALEETELLDSDIKIPYLQGEVFVYQDLETTQQCLEKEKLKKRNEINEIKKNIAEIKEAMDTLKAHLYGKFGSHINLEPEEE